MLELYRLGKIDEGTIGQIKQVFERMDKNRDGSIHKREIVQDGCGRV